MIMEGTITIEASAERVWEVFAEVEQWPTWTASVTRLSALDGPELAVGRRFEIKQPRFPKLVWRVTELDAGHAWSWVQRSLGGTTTASHELTATSAGQTVVRQTIEQRGPIGVVVGVLTRRLTRRYLSLEAEGLKARCEEPAPARAAGS